MTRVMVESLITARSAISPTLLGRTEDVARAILFFADPSAGFVTGQTLFVCGGTSVGSIVY
jgi:NAD(P)-dependent dehydrogenase (short-subunit alcohol dehydrogenase family)